MANNKFKAAVKKAKGLYKTGRYKKFSDAVKAAYKKVKTVEKRRKVGATKFIERGESKSTPAKRVIRRNRTKKGYFKSTTRISGVTAAKRKTEKTLATAMLNHYKTQSIKRTKQLDKQISALKKKLKAF